MDTTREKHKNLAAFGIAAALVLAIAQLGSYLVYTRLPLNDTYVVSSLLHFTHIQNTGAIFGMFPGNSMVIGVISCLVIVGITVYLSRLNLYFHQYICFGFIAGAAASNVCDRLVYGAVIDFIYVRGIPHWNYVFNLADTAIHLGVWPLAVGSLLWPGPESHRPATPAAGEP